MNIKHMRLVLPLRMTASAHMGGRMIAEAAARALHGTQGINRLITVQVQGRGQSAMHISQGVFREIRRQARTQRKEG
jgi:hypothetical protein